MTLPAPDPRHRPCRSRRRTCVATPSRAPDPPDRASSGLSRRTRRLQPVAAPPPSDGRRTGGARRPSPRRRASGRARAATPRSREDLAPEALLTKSTSALASPAHAGAVDRTSPTTPIRTVRATLDLPLLNRAFPPHRGTRVCGDHRRPPKTTESGPPPSCPVRAAGGHMRIFEHARSRQPALGGSPWTDSGSAGNPNSTANGRKSPDSAVSCENRLENLRCFMDLQQELPTLAAE